MPSVRTLKETGNLFLDFRFRGQRCREYTLLPDTPANRKKLQKLLDRIEESIAAGTFDYARFFPGSKKAAQFTATLAVMPQPQHSVPAESQANSSAVPATTHPIFKEFAEVWMGECAVAWRRTQRRTINDILKAHLLPNFGSQVVSDITKADILAFRSTLAKVPGRKAEFLSSKRINAIMAPLRQILNEAADRFEFNTPYRNIKPLKIQRSDVEPFSLEEVQRILSAIRADFRNYYTVRFFTGMRTGEIDGLKWKYIDFERRQILVRETIVAGEEDTTKTEGSQREIQMSDVVFRALKDQEKATRSLSQYVFCTRDGGHLDHTNVTKRVWYPILNYLGLKRRRPYQSRHTAATLWLASGENPLWIARQLGHTSTEMLFKVYSRFVPNLTRQDGSAFERLLLQSGATSPVAANGEMKAARNEGNGSGGEGKEVAHGNA